MLKEDKNVVIDTALPIGLGLSLYLYYRYVCREDSQLWCHLYPKPLLQLFKPSSPL